MSSLALLGQAIPALAEDAGSRGAHPLFRAMFARPAGIPSPPENPTTPEKIALGAKLFGDSRLSAGANVSCATCHDLGRGFTDGRRRSRAFPTGFLARNTPAIWNLAWAGQLFWDGRAKSLEAQARVPIEAADEMAGRWPEILARLDADAPLQALRERAFPGSAQFTETAVLQAIAAYERSLVSKPTRFDAWIGGDAGALSAAEVRGFELFTGRAGCVVCHSGWRFTDDRLRDIGLPARDARGQRLHGAAVPAQSFKTPGLRELTRSAPYMHDGSLPTLEAVVAHYSGGFEKRPSLDVNIKRNLRLSPRERADLVALLRALSSGPGKPL